MTKAAEYADAGAPSGTIILAEQQTAGQGRHGHAWHSEPGNGLYLTRILRPHLEPDDLPVITLTLGLATAEAIMQTTGVAVDLRWPNDVMVGSRKCAGILAQWADGVLLAGIGINVNHPEFPPEIAHLATSLRLESKGRAHDRELLLTNLIGSLDQNLDTLQRYGREPVLNAFTQASSYVRGRRVVVDDRDTGVTDGLDARGFLFLRRDDGSRTLILAGGVRPAPCS